MTERESLIELIKTLECNYEKTCPQYGEMIDCASCPYDEGATCNSYARKADYLLANGVMVPPCKVGDTVYRIIDTNPPIIKGCKVRGVEYVNDVWQFIIERCLLYGIVGVNIFLSRAEAEQALKARENTDDR